MKIPIFSRDPETEIDPVCGMNVPIDNPNGGTHDHEDKTYYFCAPGCRVAFSKVPEKYLSADYKASM